jgi:hypothetical protein
MHKLLIQLASLTGETSNQFFDTLESWNVILESQARRAEQRTAIG